MDNDERQKRLAVDLANVEAISGDGQRENLNAEEVWIVVAALIDSHQVMLDGIHEMVTKRNANKVDEGLKMITHGIRLTIEILENLKGVT